MGEPIFRVGGIASGLDTESIINSLVEIERIPINRMAVQRAQVQAKNTAWTDITTQVSQLRTTVDELRFGGGLDAASATSSHPETVAATVTGTPAPASFSFTVDQVAATHGITTTTGLAESTSTVGAGSFTVTVDATDHVITTDASTTLEDLASSIRNLGVGVNAAVLKVADNDHRLSITADASGASGVFSTASTGLGIGTEQILSQGADASLTVGSGPGAISISRSTNVINDLINGVELELLTTSTETVTVTTERDAEAIADNIIAVFDAEPIAIKQLSEGHIDAMVVQNPFDMGFQAVKVLKAMHEKDAATVKAMFPNEGKDGDLYDTGLKVVVPDGTPLKADMFGEKTQFLSLAKFKEWLDKYNLKGS